MANLLQRIFKSGKTEQRQRNFTNDLEAALLSMYSNQTTNTNPLTDPTQIATVYTCIKILSETLARLPMGVYKSDPVQGLIPDTRDPLHKLLSFHPNAYTSPFAFLQSLEYWRNLRGESYARIHRDANGWPERFELVPPSKVTGWNIERGELYYHLDASISREPLHSSEILHFRMVSDNGINGITPIRALYLSMYGNYTALGAVTNFYQNNAFSPKALKSIAQAGGQKKMIEALDEFNKKYAGWSKSGKIIPLPPNTELQDMAISIEDAKILDTVKFTTKQICGVYGVPEYMAGGDQPKFSNMEQSQLNFKVNTMVPIIKMYVDELEFKCLTDKQRAAGKVIKFDTLTLTEADYKTQIEAMRTLFNVGAISPNQIAKLIQFIPTFEGGDAHYIQSNMAKVNPDGSLTTDGAPNFNINTNNQKIKSNGKAQPINARI